MRDERDKDRTERGTKKKPEKREKDRENLFS